jgi:condensin complex subunit 3
MSSQITEERIKADLKTTLESDAPEVQAVAVEGIAKLMLTKVLRDAEVHMLTLLCAYLFLDTYSLSILT